MPATTHILALYNLDAYPDGTVYALGAPLETAFPFTNFNDAFDAVLDFADEFQTCIVPVEAAPASLLEAIA